MDKILNKTDDLIKRVIKSWDIKDFNIESIDPVIRLLIACVADESRNLENKINESSSQVEQMLVNTLLPYGLFHAKPAYGVIHATPLESFCDIDDRQSFVYDKTIVVDGKKETVPVSFKPVVKSKILRASVQYVFNGRELASSSDGQTYYPDNNIPDKKTLWIGLSVDESVTSLGGLTLFFAPSRNSMLQSMTSISYLPDNIRLVHNNREISHESGFDIATLLNEYQAGKLTHQYTQSLLSYFDLVLSSLSTYSQNFIKLRTSDSGMPLLRTKYPDVFSEIFDHAKLEVFSENLVWLELHAEDTGFSAQQLPEVYCNAIPVVNLRNVYVTLSKDEPIKKIQSNSKEELVGVIDCKIFDLFHNQLGDETIDASPFILRSIDMEKYSGIDDLNMIENLIKRFENDYQVFNEYLSVDLEVIDKLRQAIRPLYESIVKKRNVHVGHDKQYLIYNPQNDADVESVEVNCLLTNGSFANNITKGEKLKSGYSLLASDSLAFITKSMGGRDPLNHEQKKTAMQYLLLSHNQLVTREDINKFCFLELGDMLHKIDIKDSVFISTQGPRKCILVKIQLNQDKCNVADLPLMKAELENKIHFKSNTLVPVKIHFDLV